MLSSSISSLVMAYRMFHLTKLVALAAVYSAPALTSPLLSKRIEGGYEITNNCNRRIWYDKIGETTYGNPNLIVGGYVDPNTTTSGSYGPDGDGISIKLSWHNASSSPYQFETTVDKNQHKIWYDLSAINGDPFVDVENGVWPNDGSGPLVWCPVGSSSCAFQYPTDNKTHCASLSAVLVLSFC